MENIVVHKGTEYHSAFPEIIRLNTGDLVAVFRQAPFRPPRKDRGPLDSKLGHHHVDDGSRIAMVRSTDDGATWDPATHSVVDAADGSNDLNMAMISQVSSGDLIVNNHRWSVNLSDEQAAELGVSRNISSRPEPRPFGAVVFDSLYFLRSDDLGQTWSQPQPVEISSLAFRSHTGKNGIVEMPDGSWLLPLHGKCSADEQDRVFLVRSTDAGRSWGEPSTVAYDPENRIGFHEPPMIRLSSGKLLSVMRTNDADGYLYQAFSTDDGWVWQGLKRTAMWGHPCNLLELRSGRILCTYGYRREPFGVRAAISDDEGATWDMENEIVIRDDGLHGDLGYPASIQLQDGRILSVYYFHGEDGIRYIGGSIYAEDLR